LWDAQLLAGDAGRGADPYLDDEGDAPLLPPARLIRPS
jgi:hypothetical protein